MSEGIFSGEVENNYKPMPDGIYSGRVTNIEMRTSRAGNDYLNIEFTLDNNRKVWDRLMWHNEACINVTKGKLEALGFTRDERKELTPESMPSAVHAMALDKQYEIKVGIDANDTDRNVVKYYSVIENKPF